MATRRGHGEGSISQRPDGRWQGRLELGWENGKRQRKTLYGKTRKAVAAKLTKALTDARTGELIADERQTVAQFLNRWLADVAKARVRPLTYRSYENAISKYVVPHLGPESIARLTPQHVQRWLSTLEKEGVSAARRAYLRGMLRNAWNTALRWKVASRNVAALVDAPRVVTHEIQPLNPEQAQQLLKAVAGKSLEALVTVGLSCGLRRGEMLGLKWADVDLEQGTLRVRHALQRFGGDGAKRRPLLGEQKRVKAAIKEAATDGEREQLNTELAAVGRKLLSMKTSLQLVEPKSSRSRRTIMLPAVAVKSLKAHRVEQLKAKLAAGEDWKNQGFVFATAIGTPLEPRRVTREFRTLLTDADLPPVRLHDLRHSCATLLLAQGVNPRVVMEILGHSQVSLTLNTYSHVLPQLQREAASKIDAVLS